MLSIHSKIFGYAILYTTFMQHLFMYAIFVWYNICNFYSGLHFIFWYATFIYHVTFMLACTLPRLKSSGERPAIDTTSKTEKALITCSALALVITTKCA